MAGIDNAKVKWRVVVRAKREGKWMKRGLFETKKGALERARELRLQGWKRGNVSVIRYESKP